MCSTVVALASPIERGGLPVQGHANRDGKMEDGDFMKWMQPDSGVIKAVVEM